MADRGSEEYEDDNGNVFPWKRCEVPACTNMVCLGLSPIYCWPHAMSGGSPTVTARKDILRRAVKRLAEIEQK